MCKSIQKKNILDYKKKDERGIEGVPVLEWELSHTPSIVEPLETPIIYSSIVPHTDRGDQRKHALRHGTVLLI